MDAFIVLLEAANITLKRFIIKYFATVHLASSQLCSVNVHINEDLTSIRNHKLPTPVSLFNVWLVLCWHNIVNTLSLPYNSLLFKMTSVQNNSLYLILAILQWNYWGVLIFQGTTRVHWNTVWKLLPTAIATRESPSHSTAYSFSFLISALQINRLNILFFLKKITCLCIGMQVICSLSAVWKKSRYYCL